MVVLTLIIGVLNVCLGYALAVRLGFGPPSLLETWRTLGLGPGSAASDAPAKTPPHDALGDMASMSPEQMLDDASDGEMSVQPCDEPYDDDVAEMLRPDVPENWDLSEKYVETSILKLNVAMMKSGARATEIDTRLRACKGHSDAESIETCLVQLKEDCRTYLAEQGDAAERFHARIGELGELAALGEEIEMANLEQAAQIETTLSNLEHMDFHSDLEAANHRLLEELHHLRVARHRLRDNQEAAFLAIARYENRMDKIEKQLCNDPLTRLRNRIGLETTLCDWWQEERHKLRQMSAAILDADSFGKINQERGSLVGDRILYQLAHYLQATAGKANLVGRFSGESFLVMMLDVGPHAACKGAEILRQSIEKISFLFGEQVLRVTVAGGVTEVTPEDTPDTLLQRLAASVKQAKQEGPNRLFFHDGREAKLIQSPHLAAKEIEIAV